MKNIKILMVDDESEYCESFKNSAEQIGLRNHSCDIEITDVRNWEDANELLSRRHFDAVILDAKCLINREQETDDFEFLAVALNG